MLSYILLLLRCVDTMFYWKISISANRRVYIGRKSLLRSKSCCISGTKYSLNAAYSYPKTRQNQNLYWNIYQMARSWSLTEVYDGVFSIVQRTRATAKHSRTMGRLRILILGQKYSLRRPTACCTLYCTIGAARSVRCPVRSLIMRTASWCHGDTMRLVCL